MRIIIANKKYKMAKKIKKNENYLRVFNNIWKIKDLTFHQIMVLSLLVSYDELNEKDITLTNKAIAKHFNFIIAKKTVDAFIPKLEELGYITKHQEDVWSEYSNNYESKRHIEITSKTYAIINDELPIEEGLQSAETTTHSIPLEALKEPESTMTSTAIEAPIEKPKTSSTYGKPTIKKVIDTPYHNTLVDTKKLITASLSDNKLNGDKIYEYLNRTPKPATDEMTPEEFLKVVIKNQYNLKSLTNYTINYKAMVSYIENNISK